MSKHHDPMAMSLDLAQGQSDHSNDPSSDALDKATLRKWARAQRQQLSASIKPVYDSALAEGVDQYLKTQRPSCLALYWPLLGEPDVRSYWPQWLAQGWQLCLPYAQAGEALRFRPWQTDCAMTIDACGIPTPATTNACVPDYLLMPCVAFGVQAGRYFRLGYGGGFYDRTLASLGNQAVTLGLAYECTRLSSLVVEPHDQPMHYLLTEQDCFASTR